MSPREYKSGMIDRSFLSTNIYIRYSHQSGEGSTGSGSSGGGGGSGGMKASRQRSPGAVVRGGDSTEEPGSSNMTVAELDDFVSNVNPPTDDEAVSETRLRTPIQ